MGGYAILDYIEDNNYTLKEVCAKATCSINYNF